MYPALLMLPFFTGYFFGDWLVHRTSHQRRLRIVVGGLSALLVAAFISAMFLPSGGSLAAYSVGAVALYFVVGAAPWAVFGDRPKLAAWVCLLSIPPTIVLTALLRIIADCMRGSTCPLP